MVRFFFIGVIKPKISIKTSHTTYTENIKWMHEKKSKIKPNDYKILNANEFEKAMKEAKKMENNSDYHK